MKTQSSFLAKAKALIAFSLLISALFSCSKKDMHEPAIDRDNNITAQTAVIADTEILVAPEVIIAPEVIASPNLNPSVVTPNGGNGHQVITYTLVNAVTNQDIMTITPGAVISLSKTGARKLNIRANLAGSSSGVVQMVLNGAAQKLRYDDKFPYAVFGDDSGDYHNWTPVLGEYTLKAITYAGTKTNLGAVTGNPYTISFTVGR